MRAWLIVFAAVATVWLPTPRSPGQAATPARSALPPLSYACPMDPDVVDDKPGTCPRCGMPLEPVRLDTAFSCPVHTFVIEGAEGRCRVCRRELVPITVSLSFACRGEPANRTLSPGACADGSLRTAVRERRAHGDHNPRHGGEFFMAPDNWHHLEGTFIKPDVFRVYLYDDFTRPLPRTKLREARATALARSGAGGPAERRPAVPLAVSKDGRALEARLGGNAPVSISLRIAFAPGAVEHQFDFSFPLYASDNTPDRAANATAIASPRPGPAPSGSVLFEQLMKYRRDVDAAVASGAYGAVYVPALAAKDVALEIDAALHGGPNAADASAAVKRIVIAAWLLDSYGDLGDRERIEQAHAAFDGAVDALVNRHGR